jgi:hypothetical protein
MSLLRRCSLCLLIIISANVDGVQVYAVAVNLLGENANGKENHARTGKKALLTNSKEVHVASPKCGTKSLHKDITT